MTGEDLEGLARSYIALADEIDALREKQLHVRRQMIGLTWEQAKQIARLGFHIALGKESIIGYRPFQILEQEFEFKRSTRAKRQWLANAWSRKEYERRRAATA